jgi:hypothetical protein
VNGGKSKSFRILTRTVLILVLITGFLFNISEVKASEIGTKRFETYLRMKMSELANQSYLLDKYGQKYNVDPRLIIAISGAETSFGNNRSGKNCSPYKNPWNFLTGSNCWRFSDWEESINQIFAQMRLYREKKNIRTIDEIRSVYCPSGNDCIVNWSRNVKKFYAEQGGDPNSDKLTYSLDLGTNGIDLWKYCSLKWSNVYKSQPIILKGSAYNWYCQVLVNGNIQTRDIDTYEACDWQYRDVYVTNSPSGYYPRPRIIARTDNWRDPYSWRCYYQQ